MPHYVPVAFCRPSPRLRLPVIILLAHHPVAPSACLHGLDFSSSFMLLFISIHPVLLSGWDRLDLVALPPFCTRLGHFSHPLLYFWHFCILFCSLPAPWDIRMHAHHCTHACCAACLARAWTLHFAHLPARWIPGQAPGTVTSPVPAAGVPHHRPSGRPPAHHWPALPCIFSHHIATYTPLHPHHYTHTHMALPFTHSLHACWLCLSPP